MRTTCVSLIVILALCLSSSVAGAQAANGAGHLAAAAARRQLEGDLTNSDPTARWNGLRAASSLEDPWLAKLALPLCQSNDVQERVLALEVVANTKPELGRAEFIDALHSDERAFRLRGLLGLAELGDQDMIFEIVAILRDDPDPDLRVVAARAIGSIGDLRAVPALHEAIEDPVPAVGEEAVRVLVAMNDPDVADILADRLENGDDSRLIPLLRMIAMVPDPSLVDTLVPYLEHDNALIRSYAAAAILSVVELTGQSSP